MMLNKEGLDSHLVPIKQENERFLFEVKDIKFEIENVEDHNKLEQQESPGNTNEWAREGCCFLTTRRLALIHTTCGLEQELQSYVIPLDRVQVPDERQGQEQQPTSTQDESLVGSIEPLGEGDEYGGIPVQKVKFTVSFTDSDVNSAVKAAWLHCLGLVKKARDEAGDKVDEEALYKHIDAALGDDGNQEQRLEFYEPLESIDNPSLVLMGAPHSHEVLCAEEDAECVHEKEEGPKRRFQLPVISSQNENKTLAGIQFIINLFCVLSVASHIQESFERIYDGEEEQHRTLKICLYIAYGFTGIFILLTILKCMKLQQLDFLNENLLASARPLQSILSETEQKEINLNQNKQDFENTLHNALQNQNFFNRKGIPLSERKKQKNLVVRLSYAIVCVWLLISICIAISYHTLDCADNGCTSGFWTFLVSGFIKTFVQCGYQYVDILMQEGQFEEKYNKYISLIKDLSFQNHIENLYNILDKLQERSAENSQSQEQLQSTISTVKNDLNQRISEYNDYKVQMQQELSKSRQQLLQERKKNEQERITNAIKQDTLKRQIAEQNKLIKENERQTQLLREKQEKALEEQKKKAQQIQEDLNNKLHKVEEDYKNKSEEEKQTLAEEYEKEKQRIKDEHQKKQSELERQYDEVKQKQQKDAEQAQVVHEEEMKILRQQQRVERQKKDEESDKYRRMSEANDEQIKKYQDDQDNYQRYYEEMEYKLYKEREEHEELLMKFMENEKKASKEKKEKEELNLQMLNVEQANNLYEINSLQAKIFKQVPSDITGSALRTWEELPRINFDYRTVQIDKELQIKEVHINESIKQNQKDSASSAGYNQHPFVTIVYHGQVNEENQPHGVGRMEWRRKGGVYEGQFLNGKRQGYGRLIWYDGSYYEGMFEDDGQNGQGKFGQKEAKSVLIRQTQTFSDLPDDIWETEERNIFVGERQFKIKFFIEYQKYTYSEYQKQWQEGFSLIKEGQWRNGTLLTNISESARLTQLSKADLRNNQLVIEQESIIGCRKLRSYGESIYWEKVFHQQQRAFADKQDQEKRLLEEKLEQAKRANLKLINEKKEKLELEEKEEIHWKEVFHERLRAYQQQQDERKKLREQEIEQIKLDNLKFVNDKKERLKIEEQEEARKQIQRGEWQKWFREKREKERANEKIFEQPTWRNIYEKAKRDKVELMKDYKGRKGTQTQKSGYLSEGQLEDSCAPESDSDSEVQSLQSGEDEELRMKVLKKKKTKNLKKQKTKRKSTTQVKEQQQDAQKESTEEQKQPPDQQQDEVSESKQEQEKQDQERYNKVEKRYLADIKAIQETFDQKCREHEKEIEKLMNNHESEIKMKEDKFREQIDEQDKLTTDKLKTQKEEMAADFQRREEELKSSELATQGTEQKEKESNKQRQQELEPQQDELQSIDLSQSIFDIKIQERKEDESKNDHEYTISEQQQKTQLEEEGRRYSDRVLNECTFQPNATKHSKPKPLNRRALQNLYRRLAVKSNFYQPFLKMNSNISEEKVMQPKMKSQISLIKMNSNIENQQLIPVLQKSDSLKEQKDPESPLSDQKDIKSSPFSKDPEQAKINFPDNYSDISKLTQATPNILSPAKNRTRLLDRQSSSLNKQKTNISLNKQKTTATQIKREEKVIVIGDSGVGKTSLIQMYCSINSRFTDDIKPTIGAYFSKKEVNIDGTIVTLQIRETAGNDSNESD